ncbi:MAG: hypothetical protein ABEJ68_08940 [Halobacteriaceae archaeon]
MLTIDVSDFSVEFKDGAIKNVGAANKRATAKLFDVADAEVREYGSERVKLVFEDETGDEVQVALSPEQATEVADGVEGIREESASD